MASGRENFGSSTTAVLAMAGSAIGLGNIWRFPYMVGSNGGAAYIIVYLLLAIFLSLPILLSETIIGRSTASNTFGAMEKLAPGTKWKWIGLLTIISPLIILSYYSVVGGWSIEFLWKSVSEGFGESSPALFGGFISKPWAPLVCHTIFLALTAGIVMAGVKSGIEKFNNISMPLLFVLIIVIMVYSLSLPGASEGVEYLVKPDFGKLTPSAIASAMGQSFFSLSLGVGTILTYSSYMKKDADILASGFGTAVFDLLFALIAGFAIMPAVFAAGIEPGAGPGLIFETLPYIFGTMVSSYAALGRIVSILFFLTIVVAALTSSISMFEVGAAYLVEERRMSRRKAVAVIFCGTWLLGALCSLSFGPLSGFKLFGETIFNFCDKLTSNFLMSFGSMLFVIFVGWKMKKSAVRQEFTNGGTLRFSTRLFGVVYFFIRYIAPLAIIAIFITNLLA
ncbi:MAG: sodium-dependent transporter [Bacteroidales bacterium]|nr:sodium-dependent transporter [Bacteroidales bacterium]